MSGVTHHFVVNKVSGFAQIDSTSLHCYGVSRQGSSFLQCSVHSFSRSFSSLSIVPSKYDKNVPFVCNAGQSGGYRRNPDFSRQNKNGYSRSRNKPNKERDGSEILDESDLLPSKNGPLLSISTSPNFHATSTPGPREREIVELFRKVQAQLRERAANKEEKKTESQGHVKENETVDSLLHLLRKHTTTQQGKSSGSRNSSNKDLSLDQPEENSFVNESSRTGFFVSTNSVKDEPKTQETQEPAFTSRPRSSFKRKSPVIRQTNIQPNSLPHTSLDFIKEKIAPVPEPEMIFSGRDLFDNLSKDDDSSDDDDEDDDDLEEGEQNPLPQQRDLSELKVADLRALAKTHGLKGFSRLKKEQLVQLLNEVLD